MGKPFILNEQERQRIKLLYEDSVESQTKVPVIPRNIIIGDSQAPYVDNATSKASRIGTTGGVESLWKGGMGVNWLKDAVNAYPYVNEDVENVITVIGTNGNFGKVFNDDVSGLFAAIGEKFPNTRILVVQGSWGWGGLARTTEKQVRDYYKQYRDLGGILIEPPIGNIEPHGNNPVYQKIGSSIDSMIR
jgi:hypothetical protein